MPFPFFVLRMATAIGVLVLATVVFSISADRAAAVEAVGVRCERLFAPASDAVQKSEVVRLASLEKAQEILKLVRMGRLTATAKFQVQIERRDEIGRYSIDRVIEGSPTLSGVQMRPKIQRVGQERSLSIHPPAIHAKTMELMRDPKADLDNVAQVMWRDPYFVWLRRDGLRYSVDQKDDLAAVDGALKTSLPQTDPVALFVMSRKEGLNPDLALIRVMRNLDPVLSPQMFHEASGALFHGALESVLLDKVIPNLRVRNVVEGQDPWLLIPSITEGRNNLWKLLGQQREKYGHLVSRAAFERIQLRDVDPETDVIVHYRAKRRRGIPEQQIVAEYRAELSELADQLRLGKNFPIEKLYDLVDRIQSLQSLTSYESVLADVFDPKTGVMIRQLRFLTDIVEGMSSHAQADAYLRSLVEP